MATNDEWGFDTLQVHAGAAPDPATGARATPIFATTSFVFDDAAHAAASFRLDDLEQHAYTRLSNPTSAVAEQRIAALERGSAAVTVASGQAATTLALLNLLRSGDHVVASGQVYGGTVLLLRERFAELGIETTLLPDVNDTDAWRRAVRPSTRAFFAESIGNPTGVVLDIEAVARIAHEHARVPLIVDNTLATPYLLRPLEHGADIVVHSTTKFLAGHGTAIGGVVVDGATFDFGAEPERWPGFHTADPSHGDVGYWERFAGLGLAYALRLRTTVLRGYGPAPSPFNSFLLLQGLETLSLRVRQHVANAEAVAAYLEDRPEVTRVHYAALPSSPSATLAKRYLPRGAGAVVAFELAAGLDGGRRFVEAVRLFSHLANIGDVRSLIIHPASTVSSGAGEQAGVAPGLVRLSVGIEDARDLLADLDRGFTALSTS
ncbi:aminotransferase class I/II-fold pyridoxal phosphate-dependent enzyme [Dactylosporangium vinaceum]|uniref:O-acetylhomoserine aminocarboxypropyltransferase/cysteine synthase family protein n=1 Tax=Dactylosporangium vinaceum TaxID=53362 RepID=A0ABV5M340_9ACTN|nr:aminotransferase class I/II-fold pyridoxal phosphate-dependent enzyme [Dactylosporangium vinaceum]UAB99806.1 aminotransferase class I/II-fold pyridoxal phosphate-dependent enzyme [Dactylosporangium vinaceum]